MRFGCCTNMISTNMDGTGIEHISLLKEAGYDYIELPLSQMMVLSKHEFNVLMERVKLSGIKCEVCNNFFPPEIRLTGGEVNQYQIMQYVNAAIQRALQLEVKVIVFGSSGAKNVPFGFSTKKAWQQIVDVLRYVDEIVEPFEITIAIEHLNKEESNIINTLSEAFNLAKEVDRKNVKLLVDYYHLMKVHEDPRTILNLREYIQHIHFSEPFSRGFPNYIKANDYATFFNCLNEINYAGRISIEAFSKNVSLDLKESLNLLKKFH